MGLVVVGLLLALFLVWLPQWSLELGWARETLPVLVFCLRWAALLALGRWADRP
jgi:hypothetical protein